MLCFSSVNGDIKDKSYSGWPCTAAMAQNEGFLDQFNCVNLWIMVQELNMELNIDFNALEMIVATLEYFVPDGSHEYSHRKKRSTI